MRSYAMAKTFSKTFPLQLGESWNVRDGSGRAVERWVVGALVADFGLTVKRIIHVTEYVPA